MSYVHQETTESKSNLQGDIVSGLESFAEIKVLNLGGYRTSQSKRAIIEVFVDKYLDNYFKNYEHSE